ncbi:hypothetical protein L7F22_016536 [Adiantum nelumboides]|nr:hypothetical protein [Adiantum nelumboides]
MEHGNGLLSLGSQQISSFPGDRTAWKGVTALAGPNASSAMVPASGHGAVVEKESTSGLKEHDYIGLAEVSSSVKSLPNSDSKREDELSLSETDLHLGLGLSLGHGFGNKVDCEKTAAFVLKQKDGVLKAPLETSKGSCPAGAATLQKPWQNTGSLRPITAETLSSANLTGAREYESSSKVPMYVQDLAEGPSRAGTSALYGAHLKNGTKRGYTEAMNDAARFNIANGTGTGAGVVSKNIEGEVKALPKHHQGAYMSNWVPSSKPNIMTGHWPVAPEKSPVHTFSMNKPGIEKSAADLAPEGSKEPAINGLPPSKGQAVGWPPIRSYRRHNLAKPTELYVKVNMDGMTVGRKVDLNAHSSYEGLLLALEEMFQPSNNGGQATSQSVLGRESHTNDVKQFRLLNGSDYVLIYEDRDGDWMLVGDVPWSMFVTMVRRLHITRGSEATGLVPTRRPEGIK